MSDDARFHRLTIKTDGPYETDFGGAALDGVPIKGLTGIKVEIGKDQLNTVTLTLEAEVDLDIVGVVAVTDGPF